MYITIAGNIGTGKSTLTELLTARLNGDFQKGQELEISSSIPAVLARIQELGILSRTFQQAWEPLFESVSDNPYLEDFYRDMPRWAFPLQIYFLNRRFEDLFYIRNHPQLNFVQDRCISEDAEIFVQNLHQRGIMSDRDFENYSRLYHSIKACTEAPALCIYLKSSVERLTQNIRKRGRDCEQDIDLDYIASLNSIYESWFDRYDDGPKLLIDTDNI